MSKLWVIAVKDVGEAFRNRSIYIFLVVIVLMTFTYVTSYNARVNTLTRQTDIDAYSQGFLNNLAYVLPLMYSIVICSIFANFAVVLDKAKRNIESLMASPVSIKQIWIGKALAVTLPSAGVGVAMAIAAYLVLNFAFVMPRTNFFVFPDVLAVLSGLILVPLLIFSIVTIVTYVQLVISNPRVASFIFTGIFILIIFGMNAIGGFGVSINFFPLVYIGAAAICGAVSFVLSRTLTKEKVLLSSKV